MEVTFRDFRQVMEKRNRTSDDLVDLFRGKLDDSREFFDRVMTGQSYNPETRRKEDRSWVVIPYRSVLEFYFKELAYMKDSEQEKAKNKVKPVVSEEVRERRRARMVAMNTAGKSGESEN